jgi:hypothetical protein
MSGGLEKLSVLIPLAGSEKVKLLLQKQLQQWNETGLDATMDPTLFSIYQTLAGLNLTNLSSDDNNVLANYDWRRAFAFFLNFSTVASDGIDEALHEFSESFSCNQSARPSPRYKENLFKPVDGFFSRMSISGYLFHSNIPLL